MNGKAITEAFDVFISAKHEDYNFATEVYEYLVKHEYTVFFSKVSILSAGISDYRKCIDEALDNSTHMIVVTSSKENVTSPWVEAEWGLFVNEKRSGRKKGNIISLICKDMTIEKLPPSLRYYKVLKMKDVDIDYISKLLPIGNKQIIRNFNLFKNIIGGFNKKKIFISYRRNTGKDVARSLKLSLDKYKFDVFLDVDRMNAEIFNQRLIEEIENSYAFILILSKDSLDRCVDERDILRGEILHAIKVNIKIIILHTVEFDDKIFQQLPDSLSMIQKYHRIEYSHQYFDAMIEKIAEQLR